MEYQAQYDQRRRTVVNEKCDAHSGLEEKFKALDEKLDDHKEQLDRIENKLTARSERLSAIDSEITNIKLMVIGCYAYITLIAGWLYLHINK